MKMRWKTKKIMAMFLCILMIVSIALPSMATVATGTNAESQETEHVVLSTEPETSASDEIEPGESETSVSTETELSEPSMPETSAQDPTESSVPETSVEDPTEPSVPETSALDPTEPSVPETSVQDPTEPSVPETSVQDPTEPSVPETSVQDPTEPSVPETSAQDPTEPSVPETSAQDPAEPSEPETSVQAPTEPMEPETSAGSPSNAICQECGKSPCDCEICEDCEEKNCEEHKNVIVLGSASTPQVGDTIWIKNGALTYKATNVDSESREVVFNYETKIVAIIIDESTNTVWYEFEPTGLLWFVKDYKYVRIESTSVEEPGTTPEDPYACTCGENASENLADHDITCIRKQYVISLTEDRTAEEIFAEWEEYDETLLSDMMYMLKCTDNEKYESLLSLNNTVEIDPELEAMPIEDLYDYALSTDENELYMALGKVSVEKRAEFWEYVNQELECLNVRPATFSTFSLRRTATVANNTDDALILKKYVDKVAQNNDRNYEITLESYATGDTITNTVVKPADIAVIIDQSGSMLQAWNWDLELKKSDLVGNAIAEQNASNGAYYLAYGYRTVCFLFYQNGEWYYYDTYLNKEGKANPDNGQNGGWDNYVTSLANMKNNLRSMDEDMWLNFNTNGIWQTRYGATYDALHQFVTNIKSSGVDHRIAIIGFGGYDESGSALYNGSSSVQVKKLTQNDYLNGFKSVKSEEAAIRDSIDALHTNMMSTNAYAGLTIANGLFAATKTDSRDRMTILFSDGADGAPENAYTQANILKNEHGVKVYGIAALASSPTFMEYISSNYTGGNGTNVGSKTDTKYAFGATSASQLKDIFNTISQDVSSTTVSLDETTVLKDIITSQFEITDTSNVKVYTQAYTGNGTWSDTLVSLTGATINFSSSSASSEFDTIEVRGFSYMDNFIHEAGTNTPAGGCRLVVKVPIKATDDFLGGNDVVTNKDTSGIYTQDGNEVGIFEVPTVDVKVSQITPQFLSKDIYLSQLTVLSGILNLGEFTQNEGDWSVDTINNAYVDIVYTLSDDSGNSYTYTLPAGGSLNDQYWGEGGIPSALLKKDTAYTATCTVTSTRDATNISTTSSTQTVKVYKPEITFNDSTIKLGQTANYDQNGGSVAWKHGNTEANITVMGTAPTLIYAYTPEADDFTSDTDIKVSITAKGNGGSIPLDQDITQYVTFYRDKCSFVSCGNTTKTGVSATDENRVNFVVHVESFNLVISKTGASPLDENQMFIFRVTGPDGFTMDVTIVGNGSTTITNLPVGNYTVTELSDWSWRYEPTADSKNVDLTSAKDGIANVDFVNERKVPLWLSGDYSVNNWWGFRDDETGTYYVGKKTFSSTTSN